MKKNISLGILAIVVAVAAALILGELVIRVAAPQKTYGSFARMDAPVFMESEIIPWTLNPGAEGLQISAYDEYTINVRINSMGTRGPEPLKNPTTRMLFVGDSFTFGHGVPESDSYPRLLERKLNARKSSKVYDVVNAGNAAGYTVDNYFLYMKEMVPVLEPELVVFGYYAGNDLKDLSSTEWTEVDSDGLPTRISSPQYYIDQDGRRRIPLVGIFKYEFAYGTHLWLYSHSHLYVLFKNTMSNIFESRPAIERTNEWSSKTEKNWEDTEKVLSAAKSYLDSKEIDMIVVIIPSKRDVIDARWDAFEAKYSDKDLNRTRVVDEMAALCESEDIAYLNLYDAFNSMEDQQSVYFEVDGHWNADGHEIAATELFDFLRKNKY